jgi:ferrous iron transport protein B
MSVETVAKEARRKLVAIAGNPNTGKTTLFNVLTGSRAHVGNYPGVTVDRRIGEANLDGLGTVDVLDIPGTYSLVARTAEEQIAIDAMLGLDGQPRPDAVILCADASQVVRGSYLVLQALEFGLPVVVAMTMMDEAGKAAADASAMAKRLGCDVIPVTASQNRGVPELRAALAKQLEQTKPLERWHWQPSLWLRERVTTVLPALAADWPTSDAMALWALMSVGDGDELRGIPPALREVTRLSHEDQKRVDDEIICSRYAWLDREIGPLVLHAPDRKLTEKVDRILIHPTFGFLIFLLLMMGLFEGLFTGADPLIRTIEGAFAVGNTWLKNTLPDNIFTHFLADGLLGGIGAVLVFLPQILLLFTFLGLLEDSGYLARVAYLMDRPMRAMNMHGRAFIPMLSGFACAVPAIMATRTMERRRDRLLAMLVIPLVTCSARLPVYTLIVVSLFPAGTVAGFLPTRGLLMVSMYAFGMLSALVAAWMLSHLLPPLRGRRLPFVVELPPYRRPRLGDVLLMVWDRTRRFLQDAGPIIVVCSVVLWALLDFPRTAQHPTRDWDQAMATAPAAERRQLALDQEAERLQQSFAGKLGQHLHPVIAPLGFDWKIGIGLIGAFAAREVFVATMAVVHGLGPDRGGENNTLREKLRLEKRADGKPMYTPLVGLSLLLFFALACQCTGTLAAVRRETGTWRWPAFLFAYTTALAWLVSFGVYQLGKLLGA